MRHFHDFVSAAFCALLLFAVVLSTQHVLAQAYPSNGNDVMATEPTIGEILSSYQQPQASNGMTANGMATNGASFNGAAQANLRVPSAQPVTNPNVGRTAQNARPTAAGMQAAGAQAGNATGFQNVAYQTQGQAATARNVRSATYEEARMSAQAGNASAQSNAGQTAMSQGTARAMGQSGTPAANFPNAPAAVTVAPAAQTGSAAQAPAPTPTPAAEPAVPTPAVSQAQMPADLPQGDMRVAHDENVLAFSETQNGPNGQYQQITIIDPKNRSLCVYHVNLATGQIELKSARNIEWDLQLVYLNAKKPLPNEVQAIIQGSHKR